MDSDRVESPLPPLGLRAGGRHFTADSAFVSSAVADVRRLQEQASLSERSTVLDWGCGAGRLLVGIRRVLGDVDCYIGIDVRADVIEWATKHLSSDKAHFIHVDAPNERYNATGSAAHTLPAPDRAIDVFYAYSVFSHVLVSDVRAYVGEVSRLLAPCGRAFVTAFVEEGVPDCEENPADYGPLEWAGRLHCVRYEKTFFERMLTASGLIVAHFEHGGETDGQSLYVLAHP